MLIPLALFSFTLLPALILWRLHGAPIRGDVQLQLMWRGVVAGSAGGLMGATLSSFIYGLGGYWPVGYLYWLVITSALGTAFTFMIGAVQLAGLNLNTPARVALGGFAGAVAAWAWSSLIRAEHGGTADWFDKGIICMIVGCGIASGGLGGPLRRGA